MSKISIITSKDYEYDLIKRLHELGVVQITTLSDRIDEYQIDKCYVDPGVRKITSLIMDCNRILDVFQIVDPIEGVGFFKRLLYPPTPKKIPVDDSSGEVVIEGAKSMMEGLKEEFSEPEKKYFSLEEEITNLKELKASIDKIKSFDINLAWIGRGDFVSVFIGLIKKDGCDRLLSGIKEVTGECFIDFGESSAEENVVIIAVSNEEADEVLSTARRLGFEQEDLSGVKGRPSEAISKIEAEIEKLESDRHEAERGLIELSRKHRDGLEKTRELLFIERERGDVSSNFGETRETFMIEGWIAAKKSNIVEDEIKKVTDGYSIIEVTDADGEDVPVKLSNPRFIRPFEVLTRLFASPRYGEIDPTLFIAIIFPIFFGFMLGDAIYGLVAAIVGFFIYRGAGKLDESIRDWSIIITVIGVACFILGVAQGCYLGDFHTRFLGMTENSPLVDPFGINPMTNTMTFLQMALIIGLIHLNLGLVLMAYQNIKKRNYQNFVYDQASWFILQPGAAILIDWFFGWGFFRWVGDPLMVGGVLALIGLILVLRRKGLLGIFDVTGYLGNWLSYSRILALGLATSGIAMAVNILTGMMTNGVLIILGVIICFFGHVFNLAIQALGAFIHSMRLHYVEFFGKFYEGGGNDFQPFRVKREYTIVRA